MNTIMNQEFVTTTKPQYIGIFEGVEGASSATVRCVLISSSELSRNPWSKLILTAEYACNRTARSALQIITPNTILYARDANLIRVRDSHTPRIPPSRTDVLGKIEKNGV